MWNVSTEYPQFSRDFILFTLQLYEKGLSLSWYISFKHYKFFFHEVQDISQKALRFFNIICKKEPFVGSHIGKFK